MGEKIQLAGSEVLLDRTIVPETIERDLGQHVDYLKTLIDWGLQFLKRSVARQKEATPADIVLLPVLFRQALTFSDSVYLHLCGGAIQGAIPSLRTLYETSLSIEWIVSQGKDRWARQYYVADQRQRRSWTAACVPGTPEHEDMIKVATGSLASTVNDPEKQDQARQELAELDRHLDGNPRLAEINEIFDDLKSKLGREPNWYQPGGPSSIADMAARLNRTEEYKTIYRMWSEDAHSTRSRGHVQIRKEERRIVIEPIRSFQDLDAVFNYAVHFLERVTLMLVEEYAPDERQVFGKKILEEWKDQREMPVINVEEELVDMS